ncbi:MAG: hypothetical protein HWE27_17875 [Gammaproteobacteria bacterium]|nr:hypothetical protein [Gammaproteobacteria bacterium]
MRTLLIITFLIAAYQNNVMANCEALIIKGNHTAISKKEAIIGALEDAKELCYPGKAFEEKISCKQTVLKTGDIESGKLSTTFICTQEVVCNLCGDALLRKLEAMQDSKDDPAEQ